VKYCYCNNKYSKNELIPVRIECKKGFLLSENCPGIHIEPRKLSIWNMSKKIMEGVQKAQWVGWHRYNYLAFGKWSTERRAKIYFHKIFQNFSDLPDYQWVQLIGIDVKLQLNFTNKFSFWKFQSNTNIV
jgi:hypothetical protein